MELTSAPGNSSDTPAITSKARTLSELTRLVAVPPFVVVRRGEVPDLSVDSPLLVRGCTLQEDEPRTSHAGRSPTVGPVMPSGLPGALAQVFADQRVEECVVQSWVEGPSGVALSVGGGEWLVEFSRVPGGVTGGKLTPFCALLPNDLPRYTALRRHLAILHDAFGRCDVEFVGLGPPSFVQLRPLTATVVFDRELVRMKQALQEVDEPDWEQDAFCTDLMERPEQDAAWTELFLATVADTWLRVTGRRPDLGLRPFLKVGAQLFRSGRMAEALRLSPLQSLRVGMRGPTVVRRVEHTLADEDASAEALMGRAVELNLHAALPTSRLGGRAARLFALRERCRKRLAGRLAPLSRPADVPSDRRLAPRFVRDDAQLAWRELRWHDGVGQQVVAGEPAEAPAHRYDRSPEAVPPGCVVHTPELYPELADVLDRVAGVVCAGGGLSSHLAILCREQGVPLRIQVGEQGLRG